MVLQNKSVHFWFNNFFGSSLKRKKLNVKILIASLKALTNSPSGNPSSTCCEIYKANFDSKILFQKSLMKFVLKPPVLCLYTEENPPKTGKESWNRNYEVLSYNDKSNLFIYFSL